MSESNKFGNLTLPPSPPKKGTMEVFLEVWVDPDFYLPCLGLRRRTPWRVQVVFTLPRWHGSWKLFPRVDGKNQGTPKNTLEVTSIKVKTPLYRVQFFWM